MPKGEGRGTHDPGKRDDATEQEQDLVRAVEWWLGEVTASPVAVRIWVECRIPPEVK